MEFNFTNKVLNKDIDLILCYPNKKQIGYITEKYSLNVELNFLNTSKLNFSVDKNNKFYDKFKKEMLIYTEEFGYFIISETSFSKKSENEIKSINCDSYEIILNKTNVTLEDGTYPLYDVLNPNSSLLGILSNVSKWTIGHVDSTLLAKYRTFEINNISIYNLLMTEMSTAYNCYFTFDNEDNIINAYDKDSVTPTEDILLSFDNLVSEINISEKNEDVCTVFKISGSDGVLINDVNPLGTSYVYDFNYYMNNDYGMSDDLKAAIVAWNNKISLAKPSYDTLVLNRKLYSQDLVEKSAEVSLKKSELNAIQIARSALTDLQSQETKDALLTLYNSEVTKQAEYNVLKQEYEDIKDDYDNTIASIQTIVNSLAIDNVVNFSLELQDEMQFYIKTGSYVNENFIYTSNMTEKEKMEIAQELLSQGLTIFEKLSRPCYEFKVSIDNYLMMETFKSFIGKTKLGICCYVEIEKNTWIKPRLLQMSLNYDDLSSSTFTFSETFRMMKDVNIFEDVFNQSAKSSNRVSILANTWSEPSKSGLLNTISSYMTESLDLAKQEIVNSVNQDFIIGSWGILGRKSIGEDLFDPHQIRINNNLICFSDDSFQTVSQAIGKITFNGTEMYGIVADAIIGGLVATEKLVISNENNNFIVDKDGATLVNASFTLTNNKNKILLNPEDGLKIQTKVGDIWEDRFYADVNGDIVAKSIKLESSIIGGWITEADGLYAPGDPATRDYIGSDGYGKLSLFSWTPTSATFDGNIYANNLLSNTGGQYQNVFVDGSMGGSWLANGTVGLGKLDTLVATKAYVDELDVGSLRADLGIINTFVGNYFEVNTGVFRGSCYWSNNGQNPAEISSYVVSNYIGLNILSTYTLNLESQAGITLTTGNLQGQSYPVKVDSTFSVVDGINELFSVNHESNGYKKIKLSNGAFIESDGYPTYNGSVSITIKDTNDVTHTLQFIDGFLYSFDGNMRY